jgi:hypothetical protein
VRALEDLAHEGFRRHVGIDRAHLGAVDHDVGDFQLVQVEQAADASRSCLHRPAFALQFLD